MANQSRIRRRYLAATRYQMRVERLGPQTVIIAGRVVGNGYPTLPSWERLAIKMINYQIKKRGQQANRRVVHVIQSNPELLLINLGGKQ